MTHLELLKFAQALLAESAVFRRENVILRQELKRRISSDILVAEDFDVTAAEAEAQAEKEITHMVAAQRGGRMNRDDIIRMAREAGFAEWHGADSPDFLSLLERFASLVAAAKQEEWRGMTDDEIQHVYDNASAIAGVEYIPHGFARAIDAALKEKNHDPR